MSTQFHSILFLMFICLSINEVLIAQISWPRKILNQAVHSQDQEVLQTSGTSSSAPSFYKRKADWQHIIDSTWGAGQSPTQQLIVFDYWWDLINKSWSGFPNYSINWDSLRNVYRPQVAGGLSRGRFAAIMSKMWMCLMDLHTYIYDMKVDTAFGTIASVTDQIKYQPGVPLLIIGPGVRSFLGAAVTPLPDSSNLVYQVAPDNPLGLIAGDIILGYEGVPWKQLIHEFLDAEIPVSWYYSWSGSTPESMGHFLLMAVGENWGLFDTIDVVKYSSGDTLHLPTNLLMDYPAKIWRSDQVPIPGIEFPEAPVSTCDVSWGIIHGTNVGYIYAWDWADIETSKLFNQAVDELCIDKKVSSLIIDVRMNWGGSYTAANNGFLKLFSIDPTQFLQLAVRNNPNDHMGFAFSGTSGWGFIPLGRPFNRPVSVLTGPSCFSAGDFNAFRMKFLPLVRSFGKSTNGAFVGDQVYGTIAGSWNYCYIRDMLYSTLQNAGFLSHTGVKPDEDIWLTPEGVAKGEDDVVKRALEWMNNLVYPHDVNTDMLSYNLGEDSVHLSSLIENPNSHILTAKAYIQKFGSAVIDSLSLQQIGTSNEWQTCFNISTSEEFYNVGITVFDESELINNSIERAARFTTAGPVLLDSISLIKAVNNCYVKPYVHNLGTNKTISNASISVTCDDPWVSSISPKTVAISSIAPNSSVSPSSWISMTVKDSIYPGYFNLKVAVASDGWIYWIDSQKVVTDIIETIEQMPTKFSLEQNYPNPFNPTTKIKYSIPTPPSSSPLLKGRNAVGFVSLKVYDILGREVAILVNEEKAPGSYEVEFSAENLSSGVFFYKLQAGEFTETKKMVLLR